jgi:hypothetical protein
MIRTDPVPALRRTAAALAGAPQPAAGFHALERAMQDTIGHRLFTIMRHDRRRARNRRVYSSDPAAYPVAGGKPVDWTHPWTQHVLVEGQAWIGRDASDIAWAFPDHEKILAMGLASAMNLPVRWNGETIGTVNLLHGPGHYGETDAALGAVFAALALPALLGMDAG